MNLFIYQRCLAILMISLSIVLAGQVSETGLHTNTHSHITRQESTASNYMSTSNYALALLLGQGQQTFCQAVMLSNTTAVLAASCFEFDGNMQADIAQYSLAIELDDAAVITPAQISNITPHPNYDAVSFANNIAIVTFSEIATTKLFRIDNLPSLWSSFMHARASLNADNSHWNNLKMEVAPLGDQNECGASSSLFQAYQSDFICSEATLPASIDEGCNIPYAFIVGLFETETNMLGFYSHSSIEENTSFCDTKQLYNYYLNIAHYIPWINTLIDPDVDQGNRLNIAPDAVNKSYSMTNPASESINGRIIRSFTKNTIKLSDDQGNLGLLAISNGSAAQDYVTISGKPDSETKLMQRAYTEPSISDVLGIELEAELGVKIEAESGIKVEAETLTGVAAESGIPAVFASGAEAGENDGTETETETTTETTTSTETVTSISTTSAEPITVTVADTIINTKQLTNIVSATHELTATSDHTTTVSETVTTTDTITATETVTATLLQTLTGILTNIQSDTLIQSQTLTSLITTTLVSESECPVVVCSMSTEVDGFTVTVTEMNTSVETQTVTLTEFGKMTVDSLELSTIMVTVTAAPPPETVTETVASDQSIAPLTVTTITVETLVISETKTLEGNVESIFATVTTEIEPSSSPLDEPETEMESIVLKPWMIALIVVALLLIMALLGFIYYRWKRKQREQYLAGLATTDYNLNGYDKFGTSRSYISEGGRSRYNSKGSYVGYI